MVGARKRSVGDVPNVPTSCSDTNGCSSVGPATANERMDRTGPAVLGLVFGVWGVGLRVWGVGLGVEG